MNTKTAKTFLIILVILGFNYSVSFQQFLHFDRADPKGLGDSSSYLALFIIFPAQKVLDAGIRIR